MLVQVYEGEAEFTTDCNMLANFRLTGIPPAPKRGPRIEVSFTIDDNGILNVSARDIASGKSEAITIVNDKKEFSDEEVKKMVRRAT